MAAMQIERVTSPYDLEDVYRLRYEVYYKDMGQQVPFSCHTHQRIIETLDHSEAIVFAAYEQHGGQRSICGTVRVNFVKNGGIGDYVRYYQLEHLTAMQLDRVSVTNWLMFHRQFRGTTIPARLCTVAFSFASHHDIESDFIDCGYDRIPFFQRIGYVIHLDRFVHPEFGPGAVMRLDLQDEAHLESCRSPLLRLVKHARGRNLPSLPTP